MIHLGHSAGNSGTCPVWAISSLNWGDNAIVISNSNVGATRPPVRRGLTPVGNLDNLLKIISVTKTQLKISIRTNQLSPAVCQVVITN